MDFVKKTVIIIVLISFSAIHFPRTGLGWPTTSYTKTAEAASITRHDPEFLAPPEMAIPVETLAPEKTVEKRKINKWLWVGLGAVVVGVVAAAGGGGGSSDGSTPPPEPGDITVKWNE